MSDVRKVGKSAQQRKAMLLEASRADLRKEIQSIKSLLDDVEQAAAADDWARLSKTLQTCELGLDKIRFSALRLMSDRRPRRLSLCAREIGRLLVGWGDELDDDSIGGARRDEIEPKISAAHLACARVHDGWAKGTDETYLRAAITQNIQTIADNARRGPWKALVPSPPHRWDVLAGEVIKLFVAQPDLADLLQQHRPLVARAVEASSNTGGRGKRAAISKSQAIVELCEALGLRTSEYDSIRKAANRARKKQG